MRLNSKIVSKAKLALTTFAATSSKVLHQSIVVQVRLKSQYDDTDCKIKAITVRIILQYIAASIADDTFARFLRDQKKSMVEEIMLSDIQGSPGINPLIGSDQIRKLFTGAIIRSKESNAESSYNTAMKCTL